MEVLQIRLGNYGLFSGDADNKLNLWIVLPFFISLYVTVVLVLLWLMRKLGAHASLSMVVTEWQTKEGKASSPSTEWQTEHHSVKRLLKHCNRTAIAGFSLGGVLMVFYIILDSITQEHYDCVRWSINVSPLALAAAGSERGTVHWMFVAFACV